MAVRLLGGDDATPETKAFMTKYAVRGYPALLVLNADGHVLSDRVGRSVDAMLASLEGAAESEIEYQEALAGDDAASRLRLASILVDRRMHGEAERLYAHELATSPTVAAHKGQLRNLRASRRADDERALLEKMVALYPDDASDRIRWRIRLGTMHVDAARDEREYRTATESAVVNLEKLLANVLEDEDSEGIARVRVALGNAHASLSEPERANVEFDRVLSDHPKSSAAADALFGKAVLQWDDAEFDACKKLLQRIVKEYPDSEAAKHAPNAIHRCDDQLGLNPPHEH